MTTRSSNVRDTSDGQSNVKSQQVGSVQDLKIMRVMVVGSQVWVLVGEKPGKLPAAEQLTHPYQKNIGNQPSSRPIPVLHELTPSKV